MAELRADSARRRTVYVNVVSMKNDPHIYNRTRSWSTIRERKSMRRGARSSSYDWAVSAKVYRIADTTVALVAAF